MFCAFLQNKGFAPIICYSLSAWDSWDILLSSNFLIFHHFSISTATQPFRQPQYVTASYFHL